MSNTRLEDLASRLETANGELRIAGTDVPVRDIFVWNTVDNESAGDIVYRHPELTVEDVDAALLCCWVNREEFRSQVEATGLHVPLASLWPPRRLTTVVGVIWLTVIGLLLVVSTWLKIELPRQANPGNVNAIEWLLDRGGFWPFISVAFALAICNFYFLHWIVMWSRMLPWGRIASIDRENVLAACIVGLGVGAAICTLEMFVLWQTGQPLWSRQAWETRAVAGPLFFIVGAMLGGSICKIRACSRTFASERLQS